MNLSNYRFVINRGLGLLALALVALSCGPQELPNSDLSIRNGIYLEKSDKNTAPGLVFIGMCSATLVSTNTLITAAHCVSAGQNVCIRSGQWSGTCSSKTYVPSQYQTQRGTNYGYDIAMVVFDGTPFSNFFAVGSTPPKTKDRVIMVGYSDYRNNEPGRGSKRWGTNYISAFDRSELNSITTYDGGSVDRVAVDKGDSGGTMLNNRCELIGVTSRNGGDEGNVSIHTNATNESVRKWLLDQIAGKGAQICGLPGTKSEYCPASGLATLASNPAKEEDGSAGFPCSPGGGQNGDDSLNDDGKIKIGLTGLAANAFKMHVSINGTGLTVAACADVSNPAECQPSLSGRYFSAQALRAAGSRSIFEVQKNFSAADAQSTWTLVGRDASGQIKQTRKIKISQ